MRTFCSLALAASLLFLPGFAGADNPDKKSDPDNKETAALMKRKLHESQKVLEGIAQGDFDAIANHAAELIEVSKAASFRVIKTPRYELYSKEFQRTAEALVQNANDKNLDAAALSYVELTLTCVKCHKHVRQERMARLTP